MAFHCISTNPSKRGETIEDILKEHTRQVNLIRHEIAQTNSASNAASLLWRGNYSRSTGTEPPRRIVTEQNSPLGRKSSFEAPNNRLRNRRWFFSARPKNVIFRGNKQAVGSAFEQENPRNDKDSQDNVSHKHRALDKNYTENFTNVRRHFC
jgi:hypothetical protein